MKIFLCYSRLPLHYNSWKPAVDVWHELAKQHLVFVTPIYKTKFCLFNLKFSWFKPHVRSCRTSCPWYFKRFQKSFSSQHITTVPTAISLLCCCLPGTIPRFSFTNVLLVLSYSLQSLLDSLLCLRVVLRLDMLKAKCNKSSNIQNYDTGLHLTAKLERLTKPAGQLTHKISNANVVIWNLRRERDGLTVLKPSQA